jgi:hypothetical protein
MLQLLDSEKEEPKGNSPNQPLTNVSAKPKQAELIDLIVKMARAGRDTLTRVWSAVPGF